MPLLAGIHAVLGADPVIRRQSDPGVVAPELGELAALTGLPWRSLTRVFEVQPGGFVVLRPPRPEVALRHFMSASEARTHICTLAVAASQFVTVDGIWRTGVPVRHLQQLCRLFDVTDRDHQLTKELRRHPGLLLSEDHTAVSLETIKVGAARRAPSDDAVASCAKAVRALGHLM
jgi:hypothetical protein